MLPTAPATPKSALLDTAAPFAPIAALLDVDAELLEDEDEDEADGVATVNMCPAKEVVEPDAVASVMAGPPEDVTCTTGTPFAAAGASALYRISKSATDREEIRTDDGGKHLGRLRPEHARRVFEHGRRCGRVSIQRMVGIVERAGRTGDFGLGGVDDGGHRAEGGRGRGRRVVEDGADWTHVVSAVFCGLGRVGEGRGTD